MMIKNHLIYGKCACSRLRFLLLLSVMAVCSVSCTQESAGVALPLDVSAGIGAPHTRASDSHASDYDKRSFVTGDVIKISKGGTSINYRRTAAGNWTPDADTPMTTTGSESFTATFPPDFSNIQADQSTPTGFWKSNQLSSVATSTGNYVRFSFAPAACKITVVVIYKADNTATSATVAGKGLSSGNNSSAESISLLKTSESLRRHTYAGIFSPSASNAYTISVSASVLGTRTYVEKGSGLTLRAGYEYQYTFTATDELLLTSVVVKEFTTESGFGDTDGEEDAGNAT